MSATKLNQASKAMLLLGLVASLFATDSAHSVSVTATPVAQGVRQVGLNSYQVPFDTITVVPVGGSNSGEVFGIGLATRTSTNTLAIEFSLAPLIELPPMRGYMIESAILTVNYAGGSAFGPLGQPGSPSMFVSGYRDQNGVLELADFLRSALFIDSKVGLPSTPPPNFISLQSFDVTDFVQVLYNQQSPYAGFRFDAGQGSVAINGFNFSDPLLRPSLSIVAVVPEPATNLLMAIGVAGMSGFAWFRRRYRFAA